MAIYHFSAQIISRSSGKSSVGASAYRSGERIEDKRTGMIHDYTRKKGIEYTEILAPTNAPSWAKNRSKLWNEVEKIEKSKKSQLAREINIALPKELNKEEQIKLTKEFAKNTFVDKGMIADIAIHDNKEGNPHAHIMLTLRAFDENGEWLSKQKKEYILDKDGNKQYNKKTKTYKCKTVKTTDWDNKENLEKWREEWSNHINKSLERNKISEKVDHRSYIEQGIDKIATKHEGYVVRKMESKGKETEIGTYNKQVKEQNKMLELINKQLKIYTNKKGVIKDERGIENNGDGNENIGINGGVGTEGKGIRAEGTGSTSNVDWSAIRYNVKGEGNRVSEQFSDGITGEIQRKVRGVKERTDRAVGKDRKKDIGINREQQISRGSSKSRSDGDKEKHKSSSERIQQQGTSRNVEYER